MAMMRLPPDFIEFLRLLNFHKTEYLLIGGYAVGYHGYPRPTGDMDIWIAVAPENAERIQKTLIDFGFPKKDVPRSLFLQEGRITRMGVPPLRIEVVTGISGVQFGECYNDRIVQEIDKIPVSIISLDDLKTNKKASGRHKDLNDLENLP